MELQEIRDRISAIDSQMAGLFSQRMEAVREVAEYKKERGLPIEDSVREQKLIRSNAGLIEDEDIRSFYISFLRNTMDISKEWQRLLMTGADGQKGAVIVDEPGSCRIQDMSPEELRLRTEEVCVKGQR